MSTLSSAVSLGNPTPGSTRRAARCARRRDRRNAAHSSRRRARSADSFGVFDPPSQADHAALESLCPTPADWLGGDWISAILADLDDGFAPSDHLALDY